MSAGGLVSGSGAKGSVRFSIVMARELTIHLASVMNVRSASSSSCIPVAGMIGPSV